MIYITLQRIWEVLPKPKMYKQLASAVFRHITALNTPSLEYYVLIVSHAGNASKIAPLPQCWELHWWTFFCSLKSISPRCKFLICCFPTCDLSSRLQLAHGKQRSGWVSPSLWVHLGKADVPARLLPSLPVHSPELESSSDICLLTPFIVTGLNVCDTYSEFKITANPSKDKLATATVAVRDVPYVWVSV